MKKLLGTTLAAALLVPAIANAELLKNFKASGSLEVDAVSANNISDLNTSKYDQVNSVQTRLMVHADWDLLDDVHAHLSLDKNDRTYGSASQNLGSGATSIPNNVFVDESYVKIDKLFGALDTTLGRQYYGEQNDMVIYFGPKYNLYKLPITALDGARFDWNAEKIGVTVLAAKQSNAGVALGAADTGSVSIEGIDVHVKPMDNVSGSVYIYGRETVNSGTAPLGVVGNDYLYVAGLKGKVTMGGAWAKAEFDQDFGTNRTVPGAGGTTGIYGNVGQYTGWAGKINAGAKLDLNNLGALTGWAEGAIGSGGQRTNRNFTAIASDYRPGGIAGRFSGTAGAVGALDNGLNNRVILGAGVKVNPAALSKLTAGLSFWNYRAQNATSLAINTPVTTGGNKFLGNEYDLDLSWAHSENVLVSAGLGTFQPGRAVIVGNGGAVNPATLAYMDFSIKF